MSLGEPCAIQPRRARGSIATASPRATQARRSFRAPAKRPLRSSAHAIDVRTLSGPGDLQRLVYRADPIPELKRQLAAELVPLVARWRRADVAVLIGTEPARVSDLRSGNVDRFSLETLIRYLARLRHDVQLRVVKRTARR